MASARTKKVNKSQPSYILKKKLKKRINSLLAQKKRQEELQKAFEEFMEKEFSGSFADPSEMWERRHGGRSTRKKLRR